jgi:hypothetical protein
VLPQSSKTVARYVPPSTAGSFTVNVPSALVTAEAQGKPLSKISISSASGGLVTRGCHCPSLASASALPVKVKSVPDQTSDFGWGC